MALKVVRNEVDGWDVLREDEGVALSNHPDRASAEAAAKLRAEEDHISEAGGEPVIVAPSEMHAIDDVARGHQAGLPVARGTGARDHAADRDPGADRLADRLRQLAPAEYAQRG